jgi:hypothetical protein
MLPATSREAIQLNKGGFKMRVESMTWRTIFNRPYGEEEPADHIRLTSRRGPVQGGVPDAQRVGPARCCLPRHNMPFKSRNEGSNALHDVTSSI